MNAIYKEITSLNWKWNKDGYGTCGTYEKDGWTIFCNGTVFKIVKPNGDTYARGYANVITAIRNAEKLMNK